MTTINFNRPILKTKPHLRLQANGDLLVFFVWQKMPALGSNSLYETPKEYRKAIGLYYKWWEGVKHLFCWPEHGLNILPMGNRYHVDAVFWSRKK